MIHLSEAVTNKDYASSMSDMIGFSSPKCGHCKGKGGVLPKENTVVVPATSVYRPFDNLPADFARGLGMTLTEVVPTGYNTVFGTNCDP